MTTNAKTDDTLDVRGLSGDEFDQIAGGRTTVTVTYERHGGLFGHVDKVTTFHFGGVKGDRSFRQHLPGRPIIIWN